MDRDRLDSIGEALGGLFGELQNTIEQYSVYQLTKYTDTPDKWTELQKNDSKRFEKAINTLVDQFIEKTKNPIENALNEVFKVSKTVLEDIKDGKWEPTFKKKKIDKLKLSVSIDVKNLKKQSLKGFKKMVDSVGKTIYVKKIFSGDVLFKTIEDAMNKGGIQDMFVTYKNGRKYTFKSYMEMNVRTTMHQEALNYQYESAKAVGVVFYLCSYHSDCANDHKDFQGKIYYDENWKTLVPKEKIELVETIIKEKKCLPLQKYRDGKPWITTRPNCRHTFKPITIEQANKESINELLDRFKMKRGKYDKKNYLDLQTQRYYEGQVRKAKQKRDSTEIELKNAKDQATKDMLNKRLVLEKSKVRKFQKEVNNIVKSNKELQRDYRREDYKTIVQDVGLKYNRDIK